MKTLNYQTVFNFNSGDVIVKDDTYIEVDDNATNDDIKKAVELEFREYLNTKFEFFIDGYGDLPIIVDEIILDVNIK